MNGKSFLVLFLLFINLSNAMDQQKNIPDLPVEVFALSIIPQIIETETASVKRARCDLGNLSLVNKNLNKCVTTLLENETFNFTEFFIDRLAHNNVLEGNKLTIAAHLGTKLSLLWIAKHLNKNKNPELMVKNALIQLDNLSDDNYFLNAHKFLFHFGRYRQHGSFIFCQQITCPDSSSVYSRDSNHYNFKKLKTDNKITHKILSLFPQSERYNIQRTACRTTPAMSSTFEGRFDLLPLLFDEEKLNHQESTGDTLLIFITKKALEDQNDAGKKAFDLVLSKKPNINLKNYNGWSVLDLARLHPNKSTPQGQYIIQKLMELEKIQDNTTQKKNNER